MLTLANYQIGTQIYESANSIVYRGLRKTDNQPVILKVLKEDYPTPAELTRYRQEYEITFGLDLSGVIKAYGIEKYQNTLVIILEDFGGESLKTTFEKGEQGGITVSDFLPIAIPIADSLGNIHAANIIHKDINLANIVWNKTANQLKIIDFGIASRLPRETPTLKNPEQLEGTLAYLSPEQTGRINRSMDYRTDLYSLGVTFYEMLTGFVPFTATDAMELVHCHIAKTPVPVAEINPFVPPIISDIVMKLMAKNAEDRYQSAFGVKADLEKCLENLRGFQNLGGFSFELAQNDFSGKFQIPQKLYGRENEVNTLLQAFERVSEGAAEMMFVAGYSGVGKTALVHEVHKPMTEKHGYFAAGKFDQYQRNIPYSALSQAFNEFCNYLLTENAEQINQWREKILSAVGKNGQVLIDVIPKLELVIGQQSAVAQVGPTEAQNRFNRVFQNFIRVFCQPAHPLVIFLDDLQWADSATLKLLSVMMTDRDTSTPAGTGLFLIGAFRDNEVSPTHPLMITLDQLRKESVTINQITLKPLAPPHINQLIADSLHQTPKAVGSLTDLVMRKTGGNPFFVNQFLHTLYAEELLTFHTSDILKTSSVSQYGWQWNIAQIETMDITDNVVDLMTHKLKKLPESAQHVLRLAACVGNYFDLDALSIIYEKSVIDTFQNLMPVLTEGLILPTSELEMSTSDIRNKPTSDFVSQFATNLPVTSFHHFRFLHDRVQQAAYTLIEDDKKKETHLQIGQLLFQEVAEDILQERIFEITDHYNVATEFLKDDHEKMEVVRLNLLAGDKAISAMAGEAAVQYFQTGLSLLPEKGWEEHYPLALNLTCGLIESSYLTASYKKAEELCNIALRQAQSTLDKARIYSLMCYNFTLENRMEETLTTGLEALKILNIPLVESPPEIIDIDLLRDLPEMTDPDRLAAMSILVSIISCALVTQSSLMMPLIYTMVNLSAKHGNCSKAPFGYVWYGCALCWGRTNIKLGYRFGRLAIDVMGKFEPCEVETTVLHQFNSFIRHWYEHERLSLSEFPHVVQVGKETGDIEYGTYVAVNYVTNLLLSGESLASVQEKQQPYLDWVASTRFSFSLTYGSIWAQATQCLMSQGDSATLLQGDFMDESQMIPEMQKTKNNLNLFAVYAAKAMLSYFNGRFRESAAFAREADQYEAAIGGLLPVTQPPFYGALALLKITSESVSGELDINETLETYEEKLRLWTEHGHKNFQHKYDLVEAEKARVFGKNWNAVELYEKAIAGARENEYLHEEAIAYELAAEFYFGQGMEKIAPTYIKEAHYRYQQWGAVAKMKDLEERYPQWLAPQSKSFVPTSAATVMASATATVMASTSQRQNVSNFLDLDSVMKASQTLSGEIVLSRLLERMMQIVIENAGAQRGFLILPHEDKWVIEAEGAIDKEEITTLLSLPVENHLPEAIISYVARVQENVVLTDARQEGLYTENQYIKAHQTQSVLCFPIVYQRQLRAILYLENNLTTGAFTPQRLNVLKMLSSQIAISLENAQVMAHLDTKVKERTVQLNAKVEELIQTRQELVQSEKMASLGRLVAGFAHELNTPLGVAIGSASTLQREAKKINGLMEQEEVDVDELLSALDSIDKGSNLTLSNLERAANLVTSFKRTAVDQTSDEVRSFHVHEVINDTINTLHNRFKKTDIDIQVDCPNDIKIKSLPGALEQILTNLLMNSLVHGFDEGKNAGAINIAVQLDGNNLHLEYSDNGKGIPKENLTKIFEPFFTTHRAHGGSGLGMYICYNLITTQLQGTISCESTVGKGVVFKIDYPCGI